MFLARVEPAGFAPNEVRFLLPPRSPEIKNKPFRLIFYFRFLGWEANEVRPFKETSVKE